jgi:hypothetical protein
MSVELLTHHVENIQKAMAKGLSPEEMILRMETRYPQYQTPVSAEREAFIEAHRQAFEAIKCGEYVELDDRSKLVSDILCRACPSTSKQARECERKAVAQSTFNLEKTLSSENTPEEDVINAYMEVFRAWLPFELRRRGLAMQNLFRP